MIFDLFRELVSKKYFFLQKTKKYITRKNNNKLTQKEKNLSILTNKTFFFICLNFFAVEHIMIICFLGDKIRRKMKHTNKNSEIKYFSVLFIQKKQ